MYLGAPILLMTRSDDDVIMYPESTVAVCVSVYCVPVGEWRSGWRGKEELAISAPKSTATPDTRVHARLNE